MSSQSYHRFWTGVNALHLIWHLNGLQGRFSVFFLRVIYSIISYVISPSVQKPVEEKPLVKAKKVVAKGKNDAAVAQNGQTKAEVGAGFTDGWENVDSRFKKLNCHIHIQDMQWNEYHKYHNWRERIKHPHYLPSLQMTLWLLPQPVSH